MIHAVSFPLDSDFFKGIISTTLHYVVEKYSVYKNVNDVMFIKLYLTVAVVIK